MLYTAVQIAETTTEHVAPAVPPIAFGLIAFCTLVVGLLVTFAFRNVSNRHADPSVTHDDGNH